MAEKAQADAFKAAKQESIAVRKEKMQVCASRARESKPQQACVEIALLLLCSLAVHGRAHGGGAGKPKQGAFLQFTARQHAEPPPLSHSQSLRGL
jgi:hypothetical protein